MSYPHLDDQRRLWKMDRRLFQSGKIVILGILLTRNIVLILSPLSSLTHCALVMHRIGLPETSSTWSPFLSPLPQEHRAPAAGLPRAQPCTKRARTSGSYNRNIFFL